MVVLRCKVVSVLVGIIMIALPCFGEGTSNEELAKAVQNPIADLISIPFQNNTNFGYGPNDKTQNIMNIQPVIPFHMNDKWNLITRTIVPVMSQPELFPGYGRENGIGDTTFTAFFSPTDLEKGDWMWGAGPVLMLPTATDDVLGLDKWSIGPSAVFLKMTGPWVYGSLISNAWSFAGDSDRTDVNYFYAQPFVNYNLNDGWYLSSAPIVTANWKADSDNKWTVPLGGGVGKIVRIGKLPVNVSGAAYVNAVKPDIGPDWTLRIQVQLLLPKNIVSMLRNKE